jgi:heptosyltransferase I
VKKPLAVLIRLDKIGDLVSTLPVDELPPLQDYDIHWIVSMDLGFIPDHSVPVRNYIELNRQRKWESFVSLCRFLGETKPAIAISFQAPWWVSLALLISRVPLRSGVRSQWHTWLFLNRSLRQRRSLALQHEADYNRDLVYYSLSQAPMAEATPVLKLKPHTETKVEKWELSPRQYIVIHPGMAGSALNWKIKNYLTLIREARANHVVVVTGTLADEPWLVEIKREFRGDTQVKILQNILSSTDLLSVLAEAKCVVAPSTGVLHLAAALGVPAIGIYSPIRVQSPTRWKARGPQVVVLTPKVACPADFECLETKCKEFYCLDDIKIQDVLNEIEKV